MSNLETNTNDIQTLNKLSKFISTKSLDFLKNREIQEIFDFIQIKDKKMSNSVQIFYFFCIFASAYKNIKLFK